jgi:cytidyltransferase-like protein
VIVETDDLPRHRGAVTMVDGGFDPLHPGHVAYFEAAAALGLPVLCNVSSDEWVARKHRPLLAQSERAAIIDAIRFVAYTHLSRTTTNDVLRLLEPRYYAKGADWRGRLPEEELATCRERGIEVVYLDTVLDSSTAVLERYAIGNRDDAR